MADSGTTTYDRLAVYANQTALPDDLLTGWLDHVDRMRCALGGESIGFRSPTDASGMLDYRTVAVAQVAGDTEPTFFCEDCAAWLEDVFAAELVSLRGQLEAATKPDRAQIEAAAKVLHDEDSLMDPKPHSYERLSLSARIAYEDVAARVLRAAVGAR